MSTDDPNAGFGVPSTAATTPSAGLSPEQLAALRAKAAAIVETEFDEKALLAQLVAEEKARRAAILQAQAADMVDDMDTPDAHGFPKRYSRLTVHAGADEHALSYAPVAVNGFTWKIQRGAEVIVHDVCVEALSHAVSEVGRQLPDGRGIEYRPAPRFPYSVLGPATEAEYQAFQTKCREMSNAPVLRV